MRSIPTQALILFALYVFAAPAHGQNTASETGGTTRDSFSSKAYPVLENAQCRACHSDSGVASGTRLHFPAPDASQQEIESFGLGLAALVDTANPADSLLFGKPTNRIKHTGGERILQGSEDERILRAWVERLAGVSKEQQRAAVEQAVSAARRVAARPAAARRLTHAQYNNTVRDLLGDFTRPANQFPQEDFINGFKNQVDGQSISPLLAEAYGQAAENLARTAFLGGDRNRLVPCQPTGASDEQCADRFVRRFGTKAFRRPLSDKEAGAYRALFAVEAGRENDFYKGAQIVVEAMLQSPHFLFLSERGRSSPWYSHEVASRLSYVLWNTAPDDELLREAAEGRLATPEGVERTARRMLDDPRARGAMDEFLAQWMRFDRALTAIRERRLFREFTPELAGSMVEETRRLFHHLAWSDASFMEFFTANYSFVSSDLAALYGCPAPAEEFGRVEFPPDSGRAGVLGQALFHTVTSKPADTSATERGLFIREHFLCQKVPPPPPGVNATLPTVTDEKPMTNRERLAVHLNNETCSGCHRLVDPIGLGFEQYDAIGKFREKQVVKIYPTRDEDMNNRKKRPVEHVLDIDTSGWVAGIPGSEFSTPRQLGKVLSENAGCQKCVVKQLFRYAFGRQETAADQPAIDAAFDRFRDSGFRFRELIVSLVTSRAFLGGES
ncbi:MAG: DUF1592 domain-containing protein [Bryobacteraceae bacterium]|nr:DUF1592 domain-containing protein [Bryobacteraceae bacterium]